MEERKRVKPEKGEWPYVILGIFLFFGSIFLFVAELDNFSFTTSLNLFMLVFGVLGFALAVVLSLYYGKGTTGVERVRLTLLFLFFITLIVPVWAHFINRKIIIHSHTVSAEVFENGIAHMELNQRVVNSALENGFDLFLVYNKGILKIKSKREEHLTIKEGDHIDINLQRGILGFETVDDQKFK